MWLNSAEFQYQPDTIDDEPMSLYGDNNVSAECDGAGVLYALESVVSERCGVCGTISVVDNSVNKILTKIARYRELLVTQYHTKITWFRSCGGRFIRNARSGSH